MIAIALGGRQNEALSKFVTMRIRALQSCYEKELKKDLTLAGDLTLEFSLQPNARPSGITTNVVGSLSSNEEFASCAKLIARGWVLKDLAGNEAQPVKLVVEMKPNK